MGVLAVLGLVGGLLASPLGAGVASAQSPVTLYVGSSATGTSCTSAAACPTISDALTLAASQDGGDDVTIDVAAGTYTENDVIDASDFGSLTVIGAGVTNPVIDGGGTATTIAVTSSANAGPVTLEDLQVEGGKAANGANATAAVGGGGSNGGDIATSSSGSVTIIDSTVTGGTAGSGGSGASGGAGGSGGDIANTASGSVTITDSTIAGGTAGSGGPSNVGGPGGSGGDIANTGSGSVTVTGSTVTGGAAGSGGSGGSNGIGGAGGSGGDVANTGSGSVTVTGSTVTGGAAGAGGSGGSSSSGIGGAGGSGGDVANIASGNVTVTGSTIAGGTAGSGGSGGSNGIGGAGGGGGDVANTGTGGVMISSGTVTGGAAGSGGTGGLGIGIGGAGGDIDASSGVELAGSILVSGSPSDCSSAVTDDGYNVADDTSCRFTTSTSHVSTSAGDLGPLAFNGGPTETFLPESGNPAIGSIPSNTDVTVNASSVLLCPTADQRGVSSPSFVSCDAGSVQDPNPALTISPVTPQTIFYPAAPDLNPAYSGFILGENAASLGSQPSCGVYAAGTTTTTGATAVTTRPLPIGDYALLCSGATNNTNNSGTGTATTPVTNYSFTSVAGVLSVTPAPQTVPSSLSQTVTFTSKPPAGAAVGGTYTPTASGGASGNPVVFGISTGSSGVCSISSGVVSLGAAGVCSIDANQAGGGGYSAAPAVSQTFTVAQVAQSGVGYRVVLPSGVLYDFGSVAFHGDLAGVVLNRPVVGVVADPATGGYWLFASDGGVFSFDAPFFGSMGGSRVDAAVVGMAATPDGGGYWLTAADGGVFSFGDAKFDGSAANLHLNAPIEAITPAPGGYWLIGADGGVFTYGTAPFLGSLPGLEQP